MKDVFDALPSLSSRWPRARRPRQSIQLLLTIARGSLTAVRFGEEAIMFQDFITASRPRSLDHTHQSEGLQQQQVP